MNELIQLKQCAVCFSGDYKEAFVFNEEDGKLLTDDEHMQLVWGILVKYKTIIELLTDFSVQPLIETFVQHADHMSPAEKHQLLVSSYAPCYVMNNKINNERFKI